ncbi:T9SS type A sorting domain-containing protein [Flavobacterium sp. N1994]|uniref:T9SS type A sorting domain-containing protein n=1 Tax=Flavobacterium sp. N1994 TaxID=2986827 RepID=UPI0022239B1E|nr:T9SS type A sorting domain-containing protein [Flavobacterium sp. N1994]
MKKLLLPLFFITISLSVYSQPGSLDLSFNPPNAIYGNGQGADAGIVCTALQTDGKIIIGGSFTTYNGTVCNNIGRLNSDGSLDTSFNLGGTGLNGAVTSIALQSDGKIIIAGAFNVYNNLSSCPGITRLNTDGSIDTTFSVGNGPGTGMISSLKIQSDGKIIACGNFRDFNNGSIRNDIVRLNSNGTVDPSFTSGSVVNGDDIQYITSCCVQGDGKIVIAGNFTSYIGNTCYGIARLNIDGSFDSTFNTGTGITTATGMYSNVVNQIGLQTNGKIIICGQFPYYNGYARKGIASINTDGSIDTTFNCGEGTDGSVDYLSIESNAKIIISGSFSSYNGYSMSNSARLNADGSLDGNFNTGTPGLHFVSSNTLNDGKIIICNVFIQSWNTKSIARLNNDGSLDTTFNPLLGTDNIVNTTLIQNNGKIVIGGNFKYYNGSMINRVARLNNEGSLDTAFNPGIGPNNSVFTSAIQNDGKIIIGGIFTSVNGIVNNRIARLNTDGSLDTTFNTGLGANQSFVIVNQVSQTTPSINTIAIQLDGKIIIGGRFISFNNTAQKNYIVRLNVDGTIDSTFNSGNIGLDSTAITVIKNITIQNDGKIILVGDFSSYNGVTRNHIVRINTDGTLDSTFNPGTGTNGIIYSTTLQSDGKIIIVGNFTSYNGVAKKYITRLNTDGTLDSTFNTGLIGANYGITIATLQNDGKIVIGGSFTTFNLVSKNHIVRLNTDGSLDATFDVGNGTGSYFISDPSPICFALQTDGKIIVVGNFTSYNNIARFGIARINSQGSLSVNEDYLKSNFTIYPNPTSSKVYFDNSKDNFKEVVFYNYLGQEVTKVSFTAISENQELDMSNLASGVYVLKFANDKINRSVKVVKQ